MNTAQAKRKAAQREAEAQSSDPQAGIGLSQACPTLFDYESAIDAARRAVAAAPESAVAMRRMANTLMDSGYGISEERDWYERVLAAGPGDAFALMRLYYFAITDGDLVRALALPKRRASPSQATRRS